MGRKPKYATAEERYQAQRAQIKEYIRKKKEENPEGYKEMMRKYYHKRVAENNALKERLKELEDKLEKANQVLSR